MGRRAPTFYNKIYYVTLINKWFREQLILLKSAACAKHHNDKKENK